MSELKEMQDLEIHRDFKTSVESVWQAWSEPSIIQQWWGPDRFTCPGVRIHFAEGETSVLCMQAPPAMGNQLYYSTWQYQQIVPLQRIEYIHNLCDKDGNRIDPPSIGMPADFPQDQLHIIFFEKINESETRLTVIEKNWRPGKMMDMSKTGMEQCLSKMARAIE